MLLDDNFLDHRELQITEEHTEFLTVQDYWSDLMVRQERRDNLGCVIIGSFVLVATFLSLLAITTIFPLLIVVVSGFFFKYFNGRKYRLLKLHQYFKYEIAPKKIVRYTNSNYTIFPLEEYKVIKKYSYGLVLKKKHSFLDSLRPNFFHPLNKEILILPKCLQSFPALEKHLAQLTNHD